MRDFEYGERGKTVFLVRKKELFLLLFTGLVAGMFFAVKGVIIERKPQAATLPRPETGIEAGEGVQAVEEVDKNGDGKTDIWRYLEYGVLMRSEVDSDYDGNIDFWAFYKNGKTERQEIDRNDNGKKDAWAYFEQGVKVSQEVDSNHDGKVDAWFYYKLGKLCGRAADSDFDGKIDKVIVAVSTQ
jgi:antitoxin component YwqK of YwqJK toxin-antitoxin module